MEIKVDLYLHENISYKNNFKNSLSVHRNIQMFIALLHVQKTASI